MLSDDAVKTARASFAADDLACRGTLATASLSAVVALTDENQREGTVSFAWLVGGALMMLLLSAEVVARAEPGMAAVPSARSRIQRGEEVRTNMVKRLDSEDNSIVDFSLPLFI